MALFKQITNLCINRIFLNLYLDRSTVVLTLQFGLEAESALLQLQFPNSELEYVEDSSH